jgi:hypothetical protein
MSCIDVASQPPPRIVRNAGELSKGTQNHVICQRNRSGLFTKTGSQMHPVRPNLHDAPDANLCKLRKPNPDIDH